MIDFTKLNDGHKRKNSNPRDIFMALPNKKFGYPRDVQTEVWEQWYPKRDSKNSIIKMNTGSGKTVVGLIVLQSCLNEGNGPAVYVVPDNYLVQQVCEEAANLGLTVTDNEQDPRFISGKAILIMNIHKLVNGMSKFGMRASNNYQINSIIIDDVHACIETIREKYTIRIPVSSDLFSSIYELFKESIKAYDPQAHMEIYEKEDPYKYIYLPFWNWQDKYDQVSGLLYDFVEEDEIKFKYPLLKENMQLCDCMISSKAIEISLKCTIIDKIKSFANAQRRIFMSATLSDDSVFSTVFGLTDKEIDHIITPKKADDIGDRLILFPQYINYGISDEKIKEALVELSYGNNVLVIVPSRERAGFWWDSADLVVDKNNIYESIDRMKKEHVGLVVIINRYDGVDLPDDVCRIVVIDGIPSPASMYSKYEDGLCSENRKTYTEKIQKVEQGMGRGVRSSNDHCVIILMNKDLRDVLYLNNGMECFCNATREQYKLSEELCEQIDDKSLKSILYLIEYSLRRNEDWITASKNRLSELEYNREVSIDQNLLAIRKAFDYAVDSRYENAINTIQEQVYKIDDNELKGLFMQYLAQYYNLTDRSKAQEVLLSGRQYNNQILRPITGFKYNKMRITGKTQGEMHVDYITEKNLKDNEFLLLVDSILAKLIFEEGTHDNFEAAMKDISIIIGIDSSRPDKTLGIGPDNLWSLGDAKYLVIECKNETTTEKIRKSDCNQLLGAISWFKGEYPESLYTAILIHNCSTFSKQCSPNKKMRIITPDKLCYLKSAVREFAVAAVQKSNFKNVEKIDTLLNFYHLTANELVSKYTVKYSVET